MNYTLSKKIHTHYNHCKNYLKKIDCINYGGCLFAAYIIFKYLKRKKLNNENIVIIQLSYDTDSINSNSLTLLSKKKTFNSDSHFGISFNNGKTFYDSFGKINPNIYSYHLIITNNQIEFFCNNLLKYWGEPYWNNMFNHYEELPKIEKYFNIKFPNNEISN